MKHFNVNELSCKFNLPPGVGAEAALADMDPWETSCMGRDTYKFAQRQMQIPGVKSAVAAMVDKLRAEGFFDAHPPKEVHLETY